MLAFGDVVKLSLSNLELRETLSKQAMRDQLTTLFNRHYLAETLPREIYRAQRNHMTLCLSMLDIDHFKVFNDAYGHDAGDVILRELGALLGGSLRASDIACRYGGEEFLLVLPDCDLNGARARLRQIRLEIKRKTIVFHGQALPSVTMSVGLAQLGGDLASADALITAADEALYAAKRNGRDRIEIFRSQIRQTAPMLPSAQPALPHAVVK
jgi:diguanylate cyclase (GGDEF)-like protein